MSNEWGKYDLGNLIRKESDDDAGVHETRARNSSLNVMLN